jgi:hypothetical protein
MSEDHIVPGRNQPDQSRPYVEVENKVEKRKGTVLYHG